MGCFIKLGLNSTKGTIRFVYQEARAFFVCLFWSNNVLIDDYNYFDRCASGNIQPNCDEVEEESTICK